MVKADTTVKWFHSGMADAPVLCGQTGKLIELLDACLINGFSTRTPDSVTVSNGVATVSISAGNPYEKHAVIAISGASVPALNAEWRLDSSAATSFTFVCPGVADGAVTGATLKRAAAGWGKPFSSTNIAVYQSLDAASTQLYLRVNDADARFSRVRGYENMTDVDTGSGLFPTLAQFGETLFTWCKSGVEDASARSWVLISDGSFFHFLPSFATNNVLTPNYFGDLSSDVPGDKYGCTLCAHYSASPTNGGVNHMSTQLAGNNRFLARAGSQTGTAIACTLFALSQTSAFGGGNTNTAGTLGTPIYIGSEVFSLDGGASALIRGRIPGLRSALQILPGSHMQIFEEGAAAYLFLDAVVGNGSAAASRGIFNLIGPWR